MTKNCRSVLHGLLAVFAFSSVLSSANAGSISGVVVDSTNQTTLPSATVTIVENGRSTATDSGGRFSFSGLPEGTYNLEIRYFGLETKTEPVAVPATGATQVTVRMESDIVVLEALVVEGYREGRARALQQKQTQTNISDLISSDSIGNLPDRNIAEAVARIPGVSITGMEQGEGRYVSIRGVDPNLNQVIMDGATLAAPGGTRLGRAVPLETLGAGDIAQIEVIKSVTPDLDANSIGGTISIKSTSAFDRKGRFVSGGVAANHNDFASKTNLEGRINYSDLFGADKKWGIAVSASYEEREYANHWVQTTWADRSALYGAGTFLPSGFEVKPEEGELKRYGGNLSLEFRPNDDTQFYFRPSFSATERFEHTVEIIDSVSNQERNEVLDVVLDSPTSGTFRGRNRTERRDFRTHKDQELLSFSAGFKKTWDNFTLEPMVTYSAAEETTPSNRILAFRNSNGQTGPIQADWSTFDFVSWNRDDSVDTPNRYPLRRTRDDTGLVDEDTMSAKVDLRWDSDSMFGDNSGFIKTGVKYLVRDRVADLESYRLVPVGSWNLGTVGVLPGVPVYEDRFNTGFLIDHFPTWDYIEANPSLVRYDETESVANSVEDDYDIDEWIYSAYAMGSATFGKLTLLGGVRWERTDATIRAVEVITFDGDLLGRTPKSGSTTYDEFFPNIQAVYRFTDRLILRAALTNTIGRPAYEDARPLDRFEYDPIDGPDVDPAFANEGTLNVGNPQLGPYEARNIDVSLEYYIGGRGIVSIALFDKSIDNPIYTFVDELENTVFEGVGLEKLTVTSRRNADSGKIRGIELNVYQPFSFLPAPWDGFGIDANATFINSELSVVRPTADVESEDLPFFRQPSRIYNVTLFYERGKFSGRVAYSYVDESLETLGSNTLNDRYRVPRDQIDVLLRYRLSEHYSITASVRNLTEEPEQRSTGIFHLMQYSRLLGREFKVGVDFNF